MAILTTFPRVLDPFKQGAHSGLTFVYGIGIVRADTVVTRVAAGTVVLADDSINYIEVNIDGTVSTNTDGYTSGKIPIFTVTTVDGEITEVADDRCFFSVGGGKSPTDYFVDLIDGLEELTGSAPSSNSYASFSESVYSPPA